MPEGVSRAGEMHESRFEVGGEFAIGSHQAEGAFGSGQCEGLSLGPGGLQEAVGLDSGDIVVAQPDVHFGQIRRRVDVRILHAELKVNGAQPGQLLQRRSSPSGDQLVQRQRRHRPGAEELHLVAIGQRLYLRGVSVKLQIPASPTAKCWPSRNVNST